MVRNCGRSCLGQRSGWKRDRKTDTARLERQMVTFSDWHAYSVQKDRNDMENFYVVLLGKATYHPLGKLTWLISSWPPSPTNWSTHFWMRVFSLILVKIWFRQHIHGMTWCIPTLLWHGFTFSPSLSLVAAVINQSNNSSKII